MSTAGAGVRSAVLIGVMLQVGGLVGAIPLGWLLDRASPRAVLFPAYLLAAVSIALIGVFAGATTLTFVIVFLAGFGVIGGQTAANAVAAATYPTEVRATGVGWALGVGRVGSIVGPALVGVLLAAHVSLKEIFWLSAVPAVLAALATLGLRGKDEKNLTAQSSGASARTESRASGIEGET
jgi:AAHS family 4-hydroxybenzoate transporter-like MFS transporter